MGTTVQTMEDHIINAQISHSIEVMEIDLPTNLSRITKERGKAMENFFVLDRLKGQTSDKIIHTVNQEVIHLTILLSADLTIDLRLVLHPRNKCSHKTITRFHLMWFLSPQLTTPLLNYEILSVKLSRSPNSKNEKSRNSRLSLNIF